MPEADLTTLTPDQIARGISVRPAPVSSSPSPETTAGSWDQYPVVPADVPVSDWSSFPEAKSPSVAEDMLKSGGAGLAKGAIKIPGMIGDARDLAESAFGKLFNYAGQKLGVPQDQIDAMRQEMSEALQNARNSTGRFPNSQEIQSGIEHFTGPFYEPQTRPGEYTEAVGEFTPGALLMGGNPISNFLKFGAAPAIAGEAAADATKGTGMEPYARPAVSIGTGVGLGIALRPSTTERIVRNYLPDYINDTHIDRADQLLQYAKQQGIALTWPEALSRVTGQPVLTDMQRIIESAPTSRTGLQTFMAARPQQVDVAARDAFSRIAPRSPEPSQLGPDLSEGAGETLNQVRGAINRVAKPYYDRASTTQLTPAEMNRVRAIPGYEQARDIVRNDPQRNRNVALLPENSVGFLNEVKKVLDEQRESAIDAFQQNKSRQRAAGFALSASDVKRAAVNASTDYATALAVESHARQKYLEPLLNGPLGRIADKPQTKAAIEALFPREPISGSEHEISKAVGALSRTRPAAAQMLVRTYLESAFDEATRNLQSGPNQWSGATFAASIAGNPQQRANLKAAMDALPGGAGKFEGFEKFLAVLEATGKRQRAGSLTEFNRQETAMLKSGSPIEEVAKKGLSPGKWWSLADEKLGHWRIGRNLDQLSALITDPAAAPLLKRIAKLPPGSREAQVIALRLALQNSPTQTRDNSRDSGRQ